MVVPQQPRRAGMGSHEKPNEGITNDWLTPRFIIDALGPFDLDPCANPQHPDRCAASYYTPVDDGLTQSWKGRVWLNPPYGPHASKWLERLALHGCGTALIFARTETVSFFQHVWAKADGLLFLKGRLSFLRPDLSTGETNSGAPSVLVAYGSDDVKRLSKCGLTGFFVDLSSPSIEQQRAEKAEAEVARLQAIIRQYVEKSYEALRME